MKKFAIILSVLMLSAMVLPFAVAASPFHINENPAVSMQTTAPTIDGTISAGEWTASADLNEDTMGYYGTTYQLLTGSGKAYFAYTAEALYVAIDYTDQHHAYYVQTYDEQGNTGKTVVYIDPAAKDFDLYATPPVFPTQTGDGQALDYYVKPDGTFIGHDGNPAPEGTSPSIAYKDSTSGLLVTENNVGNTIIPSTGHVEGENGMYDNSYWDGDVFAFSISPNGKLSNEAIAPQYTFGVKADGSVMTAAVIYQKTASEEEKSIAESTDITSTVTAKGSTSADKYVLEAMIPWTQIASDCNKTATNYGISATFDAAEMSADGASHTASITIYDRYMDDEIGEEDIFGRFITTATTNSSGVAGSSSSGTYVGDMGLVLNNKGASAGPASQNNKNNNNNSNNNSGTVTTKAASTNKKSGSGTSSAQTFDAGIAVAVGALAVSAVGIYYTKKRK